MTNPTSWPLAVTGQFPDIEVLAMDILAEVRVNDAAIGPDHIGTATWPQMPFPFIHVYRALSVGGLNLQGWEDTASVFVATWAESRRQSQEMTHEVRRLLSVFRQGGGHKGVYIDWAAESSAPGSAPEDDEDQRQVISGWTFVSRPHVGPTAYP